MNPLTYILTACVFCVTLTFLFMLCILRRVIVHFLEKDERG